MIVGMLISAILGGLAAGVASAAGGHGIGHALLSYHAGGMLSFLLYTTVMTLAPRAR
jgi:hypothetical protein